MANKINITFLGTSAQIPTAKRNHSGILINYDKENILVDCGEGIQRQFRKARLNPCKITKILLTHKHGDHTFGLQGLLSTLNSSEYNKDLKIYGPRGIKKFLRDFLESANIKIEFNLEIKEVSGRFFEGEEFYLDAEKMEHGVPVNAYNFILKDKLRIDRKRLEKSGLPQGKLIGVISEGKDVSYSGKKFKSKDLTYLEKGKKVSIVLDTLKNEKIEKFVKDSDLLISEATFISEDSAVAKEHNHLVVEEISKIAKSAKVKKLILTHISQRYETRLKDILTEARNSFKNANIANDFDKLEI